MFEIIFGVLFLVTASFFITIYLFKDDARKKKVEEEKIQNE